MGYTNLEEDGCLSDIWFGFKTVILTILILSALGTLAWVVNLQKRVGQLEVQVERLEKGH